MNLLETLIRPDKEEQDDRSEVVKAANLLQVGEFQLLQLAFHAWHKRDMPETVVDRLFTNYMMRSEVPFWARQYARKIIALEASGALDDSEPHYHRYDADYHTHVPDGLRKFAWAAGILIICIFGGILLADQVTRPGGSVFPPYFKKGGPNENQGQ
jgi:hypothetical protein